MGSIEAYVHIDHDSSLTDQGYLEKEFGKMDYVKEARVMTGEVDIVLLIQAKDVRQLNSYIDCIRSIKGVSDTKSYLVLDKLK